MKILETNLEYCYGIKKLEYNFDFKNRTFSIYAPNGVMKTSFAKTFDDYSKEENTSDLAFPERNTIRHIKADAAEIHPADVLVIESYNEDYKSERISTLLANKHLKQEYDDIHKEINKAKADLIKKLKQLSGLTGRIDNIEKTIEDTFGKPFFDFIVEIEGEVLKSDPLPYHAIKYGLIFNDKVTGFLETKDFKNAIQEYIEKYDELIERSPYLGKDFKFYHAENVQKQLVSNNFFKGGHSVNLFDGTKDSKCSSDEELQSVLNEEKRKILNDDVLQNRFDVIDKKLSNKELREFRDHLLDNKEILPELTNLNEFSKRIWFAYLVDQKDLLAELVRKYKDGQEEIKELLEKAKNEKTEWAEVIRIFNNRFTHLPFHLDIKNKEDVILKGDVETIEFIFDDGVDQKNFDKKSDLLKILSTGEKRALYILNIIFEVEVRKKEEGNTLFIIDDIANSFDYKNKHAIIDYLKYMSNIESFYLIILTHNFDFLRTIENRHIVPSHQCLMAVKYDDHIKLEVFDRSVIRNPFNRWKGQLNDDMKLIASIPFVRNIEEFTYGIKDNNDYFLLTSILHYKEDTEELKLSDLEAIYKKNFGDINFPQSGKQIFDLILEAADFCLEADEGINLENKIVLSIAIRLLAEKYMTDKITDIGEIKSDQNWVLLQKYEQEYNNERNNIEILRRVNLITPANIHINSFMYEPILDMGDGELRELYKDVKEKLV